jgi:hypothetical protein
VKRAREIIPIIKGSRCQGTEAGVLPQGRLAIRFYPCARGTKFRTTVSIGGQVHWRGGGLSLQYREHAREVVLSSNHRNNPLLWSPKSLQSDNGPAFKAEVTQGLSRALDIEYHLHCAWHPQLSGKVEKANEL